MKLLLVENDRDMVEMLRNWLRTHGYEVYRAYTCEQATNVWLEQHPDLVIVDSDMPHANLPHWCCEMHMLYDTLLIVISSSKAVENEVRWLESGADDYLHKPFFPRQLLARLHAMYRRIHSTSEQQSPSILSIGPVKIDRLHHLVTTGSKVAHLTPLESKLLQLLLANIGQVCTSEQIMTRIWGYNEATNVHLIKAHIHHLRQKIELDPAHPRYILTIPGSGYSFTCPIKEEPEELLYME